MLQAIAFMENRAHTLLAALGILVLGNIGAKADTLGSGNNTFSIDFVTVGNPGKADTTRTQT